MSFEKVHSPLLPCQVSISSRSLAANGELSLLSNKVHGLEKELELERRKLREMQDSAREKDKEYQKLKVCYYMDSFHFLFKHAALESLR